MAGLTNTNTTLTTYWRTIFDDTTAHAADDAEPDLELTCNLAILGAQGINITPNKESCITTTPPTNEMPSTSQIVFLEKEI